MSDLKITNLYKRYGQVEILKDVNLDIRSGEFIVFVGPSGCGKSTLLRCISGLETITSGTLEIDGRVVNDVAPSKRGIAMVFQSYALYPHMNVFDNMAYALKLQGLPKAEIRQKVEAAAEKLQLTQYLERLPKALSGGQRQRVAIARALCKDPSLVVLDEATSSLDTPSEAMIQAALVNLLRGRTAFIIAHRLATVVDADMIVVLDHGKVAQVGTHAELLADEAGLYRKLCQRQFGADSDRPNRGASDVVAAGELWTP
jgi:multiple sugar transport system ATP-binding protein